MPNIEKPSADGKAPVAAISDLHEMALGYARDGIKIFPCKPGTKEPATAHSFKDASCDLAQIDEWWTRWPQANIALCPEDNGWCVIDPEAEGLRDWHLLRLKHPEFETFTNRTPRGGLHVYFTGSLPSKVRLQGFKIDTRGRGGYVLVPPSIVDGKPYTVEVETDVAPLPDWIGNLCTAKPRAPSPASSAPVTREQLEARLNSLDPDCDYGTWRNIVAAIHATNITDDKDGSYRRELAHKWSKGELWITGAPAAKYDEAHVDLVFYDMPPKEGGVSFGTIDFHARAAGFDGPSAAPTASWLERMNTKFAVAMNGGQCLVARLDRAKVEFIGLEHFHNMHANNFVKVRIGDEEKQKPISKVWFTHKDRREYLNPGVVFEPGAPYCPGALNLWRGWAVKPQKGKWSLLRDHLLNVVCHGNRAHFEWLRRYFALGVQDPSRPIGIAVAFRGVPGAGKGIVARTYGQLFGDGIHFQHYFDAERLLGRFNGGLGAACVVFLDEALFAGNPKHEAMLKAIITEPTLVIEQKFMEPITVKNHLRVLISSNSEWTVPVAVNDRRFAVFDVPGTYTGEDHRNYWKALHDEIRDGGQAAWLHDMLNMDLERYEVRDIPNTAARTAQKRLSLTGTKRWLHDVLYSGRIGFDTWGDRGMGITVDAAYDHYCAASQKLQRDYKPEAKHIWAKAVHDGLGDKVRKTRPRDGDARAYVWTFRPLEECRKAFAEHHKLTGISWDEDLSGPAASGLGPGEWDI